jgi:hypothetical protein
MILVTNEGDSEAYSMNCGGNPRTSTGWAFRVALIGLIMVARGSALSAFAQCGQPLPPPPPPGSGGVVALSYSLNGQTVQVDQGSGEFTITNVSAPDVFPADFKGDDFLFLTGMRMTGQGTTYYYSLVPFQINVGGTVVLGPGNLVATTTPPPLPESITLTATCPVLEVGLFGRLTTKAKLTNGTTPDVSLPSQWTSYRTSNDRIARVIPGNCDASSCEAPSGSCMLVEATSPGTAFITATNGGATSVEQVTIAPVNGTITTTVEGFVVRQDGSMVNGAEVNVQVYGGSPVLSGPNGNPSWPNGFFSFPLVLLRDVTEIVAEAVVQTESQTEYGASPTLTPIPNGITDAGLIVIELFCATPWSTAFGPTILDGGGVLALTVFDADGPGPNGPKLIAGGKFDKAGGTTAYRIAQLDGQAWSPIGGGVTPGPNGERGDIDALATIDLDGSGPDPASLYAAGYFVSIGGVGANKIGRWNGSNWSAITGGVGDSHATAYSVAAFNDGTGMKLYVGGAFTTAGPYDNQNGCLAQNGCVTAESIAKWNPTTQAWSPVGSGTGWNNPILALAVFNGELFAGGEFTSANGVSASHVAKWNGTTWTQVGNGLSTSSGAGRVTSLLVFDDGSGPALYAGGDFFGATGNYISRWNGTTWTPLASGFNTVEVKALAGLVVGANRYLYASGSFSSISGGPVARRIARWDGSNWSALNEGLETEGTALAVFDHGSGPLIHVGGEVCIANCPGGLAGRGSDEAGDANPRSTDRLSQGRSARRNKLLGGSSYAGFVATWEPGEWSVLGNGLSDEVYARAIPAGTEFSALSLTVHDDGSGPALIAGGKFKPQRGPDPSNPPPFPTNSIAKFDGKKWKSLGTGMTKSGSNPRPVAAVRALVTFDEDAAGPNPPMLFAGGDFDSAGGVAANGVARWNGTAWSAVGNVGGNVNTLAVFDEDGAGPSPPRLFVGGDFPNRIAKWNGSAWSVVGTGINNGSVNALAVYNNALYVGGAFTNAGGVGANYLARWNGSSWSTVQSGGSGVNAAIYALTVFDPDDEGPLPLSLFAGGDFTIAGGATANRVARWDGTAWSAVGLGLNATHIYSLYGFENALGRFLYAGGDFTTGPAQAGGTVSLNRIAKWNPNFLTWSPVGNGVADGSNIAVYSLTAFDDGVTGPSLFAGGSFQAAGGVPAPNIAKLGCR